MLISLEPSLQLWRACACGFHQLACERRGGRSSQVRASSAAHLSRALLISAQGCCGDNWANQEPSNRGGPLPAQGCRTRAGWDWLVRLLAMGGDALRPWKAQASCVPARGGVVEKERNVWFCSGEAEPRVWAPVLREFQVEKHSVLCPCI